ncbi:ABC-2 transporter permease [bacterium 1XD21-13]|nr:ABC-2 transporter permease [bacterium 1XD21-13]
MKGLLLKDIYNMRKVGKQYLLILLFFTCYCFFLKNPSFFPMMTVMSFSMLVLTTMGYDEAAGFDKYALTLPLNREDLVRAKYLLLVMLLVFSFVLGMLGSTLIGLFMQGDTEPILDQMLSVATVAVIFLLVYATILPLVFKLGVEKARMMMMVCYIAVFAGIFIVFKLAVGLGASGEQMEEKMMILVPAVVILTVLYLIGSYFVSIRIIRKREW